MALFFFVHIANILDIPKEKITDAEREYPFEGKLDLLPVLKLLQSKGYNDYLSVELFRKDYWEEDPLKVARLARESTVKLISLARREKHEELYASRENTYDLRT